MAKLGFDAEKYIEEQSKYILERINTGNSERLYLEFGGKLVHDKHAMRVLPGFDENAKIKLLHRMKDQAEIIICIYSGDITTSKTRADFGITYDLEVLRLIDTFRKYDLEINSVVVTRYEEDSPAVDMFLNKLQRRGITTYKHRFTKGYLEIGEVRERRLLCPEHDEKHGRQLGDIASGDFLQQSVERNPDEGKKGRSHNLQIYHHPGVGRDKEMIYPHEEIRKKGREVQSIIQMHLCCRQ